jgi:hypothetical protein
MADDEPPFDELEPGTTRQEITPLQRRALQAGFRDLGIERPERLAVVSQVIGRPAASANDLDVSEASASTRSHHARVGGSPMPGRWPAISHQSRRAVNRLPRWRGTLEASPRQGRAGMLTPCPHPVTLGALRSSAMAAGRVGLCPSRGAEFARRSRDVELVPCRATG